MVAQEVDPNIDVYQYLQRLQFYAEKISDQLPPQVRLGDVLFQLNDYLYNDRRFTSICSNRCPPDNIFLDRVIDSRRGSPLSITLIYLTVGRLLGLPLEAVSFPGRILIRYSDPEGDVVIDPVDGGMPLQENDLALMLSGTYAVRRRRPVQRLNSFLSDTDDKSLMIRMLRQLKQGYMVHGETQSALWALEKILLLEPGSAGSYRERGYLYELLECNVAAADDYRRYLDMMPDAGDAQTLRARLSDLLRSDITFH